MSVTSGFFNSLNNDRRYNAEQMSAIFDGVINDGVFANIGTAFTVSAATGYDVTIGIGRAWFNSTWLYNDAILPLTLEEADVLLDRIDAVVIEIDRSDSVRNGDIKIVKGVPSSSPKNPTMTHTEYVNQYPLAYITRKAGSTSVTQANIKSMIGTSSCPYITGILQVQNIDNIVAQWGAQWAEWFAAETANSEEQALQMIQEWNQWFANETSSNESEAAQWMTEMKAEFVTWFSSLEVILDDDAAAKMASDIVELQENFSTLLTEACVYDSLRDSNGEVIQDHLGTAIEGKVLLLADMENQVEGALIELTDKVDKHIANKNNPHGVTPSQIGAAAASHKHSPNDLNSPVPVSLGGTGATSASVARTNLGVAYGTAAGTVCQGNDSRLSDARTPKAHTHPASDISDGTLKATVKATNSTDYTTSRLRNIRASTTDLTAGTSTLANGEIYLVYE